MKKKQVIRNIIITIIIFSLFIVIYNPVISAVEPVINEFMASNGETKVDENGKASDWIELYNPGDEPLNLAGYFLSDNRKEPRKWKIPAENMDQTIIKSGGYLLFWADGETGISPLHLNFKLSKSGEDIVLTAPDGKTVIDSIQYSEQERDVSYGRYPDGGGKWGYYKKATPDISNDSRVFSSLKLMSYYTFYHDNKIFVIPFIVLLIILGILIIVLTIIMIKMKKRKKEYHTLFQENPVGLIRVNNQGKIIDINKEILKYFDFLKKRDIKKYNFFELPTVRKKGLVNKFKSNWKYDEAVTGEISFLYNGDTTWLNYFIKPIIIEKDEVIEAIIACQDITKAKKNEEKLKYLTFKDSLTGLYNRTYFKEELNRYDTKRQLPLSIILGDVNGLKLTNDAFGHQKGDELLVKISEIIKESCRQEDLIARWGGDEFVILLPSTDKEGVVDICNRIKESFEEIKGEPVKPSIALGYATKIKHEEDIEDIFKIAEDLMYKNKLNESRNAHGVIIASLKETLNEITNETFQHCERLKELALKLGKVMKVPEYQLIDLELLAELHDLGKVAISENIIKKEGPLTLEEWNNIQRHSEIGYQIACSSPELSSIAEGILNHHEWWDGSGYPSGVKGEDIPLISRIVTVVDAYDVMTHERTYKHAISKEEAIKELRKSSGIQFDPEIVEVFINEVLK